jgi:hypothetical protein
VPVVIAIFTHPMLVKKAMTKTVQKRRYRWLTPDRLPHGNKQEEAATGEFVLGIIIINPGNSSINYIDDDHPSSIE